MPSDAPRRAILHPSLVLSAYIESLLRGRRVVVLGDATIGLAEELAARGARLVHSYDPEPSRAAEALARAPRQANAVVTHAALAGDLGVRDGAFDLAIVPDLALFPDPSDVLRRVRRLLGPTGAAVVAVTNERALGRKLVPSVSPRAGARCPTYYELYDLVSLQFSKVRMIGQAPFVGYTVADFATKGDAGVTVDTSLLAASEEPEYFIAIASERAIAVDPYAVIGLPWSEVLELAPPPAAEAHPSASRIHELERQLEARAGEHKLSEGRAGDNHVRAERLTQQLRELEEELQRQRERSTRLTKQLDDEKKLRNKAEVELGMLRGRPDAALVKERGDALAVELEAARRRIGELEAEHRRGGARNAELEARLAQRDARIVELTKSVADADRASQELRGSIAKEASQVTEAVVADYAALEKALRERGAHIASLENDLAESERIGKELLAELDVARLPAAVESAPGASAELERPLRERLDALATVAARCEADLQAANWRVVQLERELAAVRAGRSVSA